MALIGISGAADGLATDSLNCVDLSAPDRVLWTVPTDDSPLIVPLPRKPVYEKPPARMIPGTVITADVFAQIPGEEIVVIFNLTPWSPYALLICDMRGDVLYETWYDGPLGTPVWLSEPGLIVCAGHERTHDWNERGYPKLDDVAPQMVFAIKPVLRPEGERKLGWIDPDNLEDHPDVAWYRCILPVAASKDFRSCRISPARQPRYRASRFKLYIELKGHMAPVGIPVYLSWTINAQGRIVPNSLVEADAYPHDGSAPEPASFYLSNLPPVVDAEVSGGQ